MTYSISFVIFAYINWYRMSELERVFVANPSISNEHLAEKCGFGSYNSMKRSIEISTGLAINAWKKEQSENLSDCSLNINKT